MATAKVIHAENWTATENGRGSGVALPLPLQNSLWSRFAALFARENLIVGGREVKGWVVPQTLGIALIVFVLGSVGGIYWRMSDRIEAQNKLLYDQKELIIRLDQRLIDKNERDSEKREELEKRLQNIDAMQMVLTRDLTILKTQKGHN